MDSLCFMPRGDIYHGSIATPSHSSIVWVLSDFTLWTSYISDVGYNDHDASVSGLHAERRIYLRETTHVLKCHPSHSYNTFFCFFGFFFLFFGKYSRTKSCMISLQTTTSTCFLAEWHLELLINADNLMYFAFIFFMADTIGSFLITH